MAVTNNTTYYYVVRRCPAMASRAPNSSEVSATPQWHPLSGDRSNPGFETPSISTYEYNPSGGSWKFTAQSGSTGSGISANGSAFTTAIRRPQGSPGSVSQGTATISQTVFGLIAGAIYQVAFSAPSGTIFTVSRLARRGSCVWTGRPSALMRPRNRRRAMWTIPQLSPPRRPQPYDCFVGTNTNGGRQHGFHRQRAVGAGPSLSPPHFTCQVAGGQIRLLWPPDHAVELQMQTNPLNVGLGTNWTECLAPRSPISLFCHRSGQR